MMCEIAEERYESQEYEFTRTTLKDMAKNPAKYGPEQLARAMVSCPACDAPLEGSVYRPRCSSCTWDSEGTNSEGTNSEDEYGVHPLDHE